MQTPDDIELAGPSTAARNGGKRVDTIGAAAPLTVHDCWESKTMLSLDGGGIRGYWSLLMLEELMNVIAEEERKCSEAEVRASDLNNCDGLHSFWPEQYPDNVSHGPFDAEETTGLRRARGVKARCQKLKKSRRFLPCHYFDYIFGSSTGALIAIMLGRFRMSVADCLNEYRTLGTEVFGHPRAITQLNLGFLKRPKFKASRIEGVYKDVTNRRCELPDEDQDAVAAPPYHVKRWENLCRTCVTSIKYGPPRIVGRLHLLRSYDHHKRHFPNAGERAIRGPSSRTTTMDTTASWQGKTRERTHGSTDESLNYGAASTLKIWQIARAATAAPFYFAPFEVRYLDDKAFFEDAGFDEWNNPTDLGIEEITMLKQRVGLVVSVGTARTDARYSRGTISRIRMMTDKATDPEKVHRKVKKKTQHEGFQYFRLNDPGSLKINLDEWKPKSSGADTLEAIKTQFIKWNGDSDHRQQLQECAKALVQRRRARTKNHGLWQHFAIGAVYRCLGSPELDVEEPCGEEFKTKTDLLNHLLQRHDLSKNGWNESHITDANLSLENCMTHFEYRSSSEPRKPKKRWRKSKKD